METVIRNLGIFSNIDVRIAGGAFAGMVEETRRMVATEYAGGDVPLLVMPEETKETVVFPLTDTSIHLGRADAAGRAGADEPISPTAIFPPRLVVRMQRLSSPDGMRGG
ncbi:hypothetical protein [Methanogenium cariaci]|uniref:hypothetical protein n=1 Tax=Methanogenium cariaci TaxID=2197 RepID=UPI000780D3A1|nr:hypothetical protein [Methanogenium cariaci]